ncbi:N-formylglutamate amidohydrolase [Litoreibacter roseus]|uniref:N-formylglutamate amidohydrolase n=1 Tax=Litoreibacter roseus TaxID=2601869 RepID=A0A6N6JFK2_9RHOB|nr:N-formylglutamate amidohydrolase [Litoreibacter roseus]GFE64159.1 N-formylglutamate amidohydrolase [Litoreibacter roseus]
MTARTTPADHMMDGLPGFVVNPSASGPIVLVCEHASHFIPDAYDGLGLPENARQSHIAWDPGAFEVAVLLSHQLDAVLVAGGISRLVYDCNRPPEAPDAMPARSEMFDVPGNIDLPDTDKAVRVAAIYAPFRTVVAEAFKAASRDVLVTIHSFTPIYRGQPRAVEIGVLHDADARLADAMLDRCTAHTKLTVKRNAPYGPEDGVTHTLQVDALPTGRLNVMIEIRSDLIETSDMQASVADMLGGWLKDAVGSINAHAEAKC